MGLTCYLAMTAREAANCGQLPPYFAPIGCHFSPFDIGLSGLPESLPAGSVPVLTDRVALRGHCPETVISQLSEVTKDCKGLLLDFQKLPDAESEAMVRAVSQALSCPVAVTENYAHCTEGPILISPVLQRPLVEQVACLDSRELWLDVFPDRVCVEITGEGARLSQAAPDRESLFFDDTLCCSYSIRKTPEKIFFFLDRGRKELDALLAQAEALGFTIGIGLYQELALP